MRRQENIIDNSNSLAQPKKPEQSKPKVWLRLYREKDPNTKPKEDDYCAICAPQGCECLGKGPDTSDWEEDKGTSGWFESKDTEEEEEEQEEAPPAEESDWDADLEDVPDYGARVPTLRRRQSRQPLKVIMF